MPFSKPSKVCSVDYRDVAEAAAPALTGDTLACGTFEMCAPGMVSRVDVAAMMSEALGRIIGAGETPFNAWAQTAHIPDGPPRKGLAAMNEDCDLYGFPGGNALVLRAILGREPRTLRQYIEEMAHRG